MALPKVSSSTVYEGLEVSYGVAPILNTFALLSGKMTRPKWNVYLINVETLIRNRIRDEHLSVQQLSREVLNDMQVLAQYIASYNRNNTTFLQKKTNAIFFYFAHYEDIPKKYLREKFPKGTEKRWEVRDAIEEILKSQDMQEAIDNTRIFYDVVGSAKTHSWPHKDLQKDVAGNIENAMFSDVLMISHVPLDFHLYRYFKNFTILESYTGALKQRNQLGKKVFGEDLFPFNKYTHLLLGDKWYLKTSVTIKMRNQMKLKAKAEHWALLPDKSVLAALINLRLMDFHLFTDPDI